MRYLLIIIFCMAMIVFFSLLSIDRVQRDRESVKHSIVEPHPINDSLLAKIATVESSNNPRAISKRGAVGLYQIHPIWIPELKKAGIVKGRKCLFNPHINKQAALHVLRHYYIKTDGDLYRTLVKYSGGDKRYPLRVLTATTPSGDE